MVFPLLPARCTAASSMTPYFPLQPFHSSCSSASWQHRTIPVLLCQSSGSPTSCHNEGRQPEAFYAHPHHYKYRTELPFCLPPCCFVRHDSPLSSFYCTSLCCLTTGQVVVQQESQRQFGQRAMSPKTYRLSPSYPLYTTSFLLYILHPGFIHRGSSLAEYDYLL